MGKITNNCDFSMPLCLFNTYDFEIFEFRESLQDFKKLELDQQIDDMPVFFQTLLIDENKFLIAGGSERYVP
jgi:hypothetical protein